MKERQHKTILRICNLFSINKTYFKDYSNKCSHLREAMISRRLSKLMKFIVNNLMPNLESSHVPLWRAPKLLEVHLPQFGNSSSTCNMLFSVEEKNMQKIQGPHFRLLHFVLSNNSSQNCDSCRKYWIVWDFFLFKSCMLSWCCTFVLFPEGAEWMV